MNRRTYLLIVGGLSGSVSGCLEMTPPDDPPVYLSAVKTPTPSDCRPLDPPTPTESGHDIQSYPNYPASLTATSARRFANAYEAAYQFNSTVAEKPAYEDIDVSGGSPNWALFETQRGFVIGVNGAVTVADTETPTPPATARPTGTFPFAAWYFLTPQFALRRAYEEGVLERGDEPVLSGAKTVHCEPADE